MNQTGVYQRIGGLDQFFTLLGRAVKVEGEDIAIFRTSDHHFYAMANRSPHPKGGPLAEAIVSGHYIYDPLYDWKIDMSTGEVQAPDEGKVKTYPVKVEEDAVWIQV
ncbi:nitrite reductase small subunit NirD [Paenibacillus sp. JX-17]|uniref:Nitrite reductase small subunit NirD n=1 Tax=Paenibacillus lacisoli TaxID=3064525 RepID=A0ABT9CFE4_9BACL|nr:nitrite reductase small subunit NirD [Paenibacillus sp. JX-17]MDO7907998.1 nitrite reductase small subunit NirD [Paenibacillus sp. JX-17]